MPVSTTDIARIAELARLRIPDSELPRLARELDGILAHMDVLAGASVPRDAEGGAIGRDAMPLREDGVAPPPMRVGVAGIAPAARDGFILVPRLSTHEESES